MQITQCPDYGKRKYQANERKKENDKKVKYTIYTMYKV